MLYQHMCNASNGDWAYIDIEYFTSTCIIKNYSFSKLEDHLNFYFSYPYFSYFLIFLISFGILFLGFLMGIFFIYYRINTYLTEQIPLLNNNMVNIANLATNIDGNITPRLYTRDGTRAFYGVPPDGYLAQALQDGNPLANFFGRWRNG